jgi:PKD repeat protein
MRKNQLNNLKWIAFAIMLFVLGGQVSSKAQCTSAFTVNYDSTGTVLEFMPTYTSSANVVNFLWTFGDGTSSPVQQPTHSYNFTGYATVCLTITFTDSCSTTYCDSVLTRQGGTQNCTADFTTLFAPAGIQFTDQSTTSDSIVSWSWDFGDGTTGTGPNAFHGYSSNGTYTVCLSIATTGGCTDTYCSTIAIQGTTQCSANFTSSPVLGSTIVNFSDMSIADSGAVITGYSWDFGDSIGTSTVASPQYPYSAPGPYYVCLTIQTSSGCSDTYCSVVNAGTVTTCTAAFTSSFNPATNEIDFNNTSFSSDSIIRFEWTLGDGTSSLATNPSHLYTVPGTYQVCLTITTANGCTDTYCSTVTSSGPQNCSAVFSSQVTPAGATAFYSTYVNSSANYFWSFGDGTTSSQIGGSSVTHTYTAPGTYLVCLLVQDSLCSDSSCATITIGASSACAALYTYTVDSMGTGFTFSNQSTSGANVYFWSFGDGTGSTDENPVHLYNSVGPHTVCLTVTDTMTGCTDTFCNSASFANACNPVFSTVPDPTNPQGVPMNFNVISPCGTSGSVTIDFGDGTVQTSAPGTIQYTYSAPGTYNVCICEVDLIGDTICFCDTIVAFRLTSGLNDLELANLHLTAYPNPFSSALNAEFTLEQNASVSVQLIGLAGNVVLQTVENKYSAGTHRFEINTNDLASGFYILKLNVNGMHVSKKVTLQK